MQGWTIFMSIFIRYLVLLSLCLPMWTWAALTLPAANIVVNNRVQPNTVQLTFGSNAAGTLVNDAAANNVANYTVTNNGVTTTYTLASASVTASNVVTLTLATADPNDSKTYINAAAIAAHIKVTVNAVLSDGVAPNAIGTQTEAGATHVLDATLPTLASPPLASSNTVLVLTFSEKLAKTAAVLPANYTLSGTAGLTLSPSAAALDSTGTQVTLTVPTMAAFSDGQTVIVTAGASVTDLSGNSVDVTANAATLTLDRIPNAFSFATAINVALATAKESAAATIGGLNVPAPVSVVAGSDATLKCATLPAGSATWGAFAACSTLSVGNGDQIKLQLTTPATPVTDVIGGITIGGISANFTAMLAAPVILPANVVPTVVTNLNSVINHPDSNLSISANGVVVVPGTVSGTITLTYSASANTTFYLLDGTTASFSLSGKTQTFVVSGGDAILMLKSFSVDGYAAMQTLELASGMVNVTGATGIVPVASLQLGAATASKQIALMPSGSVVPVVDVQRNVDGSGVVTTRSGKVNLRLASTASTVAVTDAVVALNANETATISAAGVISKTSALGGSAPTLNAVAVAPSNTTLLLTFSERMDRTTAMAISNYTLSGSAGFIGNPAAASIDTATGTLVTLTMASMAALSNGSTVTVTANIANLAGNAISASANTATLTVDRAPNALSFASLTNQPVATVVNSAPITLSGINIPVVVGVGAGSSSSLKCSTLPVGASDWGTFATCVGITLADGDQLMLQLKTAATAATSVVGTLSMGNTAASFMATTATALLLPANVTPVTIGSVASIISNPDSNLYVSGNSVLVVPAAVTNPIAVMPTTAANTAFLIQNGANATFTLSNASRSLAPLGADAVTVLKTFSVDGYASMQTMELASGKVTVTGATGLTPLASIQLGAGASTKQVVLMPVGSVAPVVDVQRNNDGTGVVAVRAGKINMRLASAASTVLLADVVIPLYANEVASLSAAGVASIRVGSQDKAGGVVGDPMSIAALPANVSCQASIPTLGGIEDRADSSKSLTLAIFDFIGPRSTLTQATQGNFGQISLLVDNQAMFLLPIGDVTVDTTLVDGGVLNADGRYKVTRNGISARLTPALADTAAIATYLRGVGGSLIINADGALEMTTTGTTIVFQPNLLATSADGVADGMSVNSAGYYQFVSNGLKQILYPRFFNMSQLAVTFKSMDASMILRDNIDGTVTALIKGTVYTLLPLYEVLSAVGGVPLEHRNDAWWVGSNGVIYVKYSNGSAQGFRVR